METRLQRLRRHAPAGIPPAATVLMAGQPPAFAASFGQQRFWRLDQASDGTACAIPNALRLSGELCPAALRCALNGLVRRHEPLRTLLLPGHAMLLQRVEPAREVDLTVEPVPPDAPAMQERLRLELERPFDTTADPCLRGLLLHGGPGAQGVHVLLLIVHYGAFDGWSRMVLFRELSLLYAAALDGAADPLPPLPLRYVDFACWQRQRSAGDPAAAAPDLGPWQRRPAHLRQLRLPADLTPEPARGGLLPYRGHCRYFRLPASLVAGLERLCTAEAATLTMGLLTLVAVLLQRHSPQSHIPLAMPVAGRTHSALEPLLGSFINLLLIDVPCEGSPSFRALLARVRVRCLQLYEHQLVPYVVLEEALAPQLPPHALAPVVVQLIDLPWQPHFRGLQARRLPSPSCRSRHGLELRFRREAGGALQTKITYTSHLFSAARIALLFEQLQLLLTTALHEPDGGLLQRC